MRFGIEKEVEIFKALANKSTLAVGVDFGFDKVYKDTRAVRNAVTKIFNKIKNNPSEYGLSQEIVDMVQKSMDQRRLATIPESSLAEKQVPVALDIKERVTNIRDKTFALIDKKLDRVGQSKKRLDEISFKDLGVIAGIAFDKTQILKGEATENIAVLAKIDTNISPADALKMALEVREGNVQQNVGG